MAKGKVIQSGQACRVLVEGNIKKRAEPGEHSIEFPGGFIGVTRTSDDTYWAHIWVHKGQVLDDLHLESRNGEIFESRVEYIFPDGQNEIVPMGNHPDNDECIRHIGVRIKLND